MGRPAHSCLCTRESRTRLATGSAGWTRLYDADALDAWLKRNAGTSHHVSGTCKMGPDTDYMAVVDQFGRVRGLDGLRVADASIMPDVIRANTNATAIMVGERVAEWIASAS